MGERSRKRSQPAASPAPDDNPPLASNRYWKELSGHTYQGIVAGRVASGNDAYAQQETFLAAFVAAEQRRLGRPLDLLEFGCGFGRHSWYLSDLPGVRYHGYDFSEPMVEPLRKLAPASLVPLEDHLFVGPDARAAVGERRFDLVLSVSVLIHNPPERVDSLLREDLPALLRPGGVLCLVENPIVPFSLYENDWHEGCWLHRYLDHAPDRWDLDIHRGQVSTHDIYVLRPRQGVQRRITLHTAGSTPVVVTAEGVDALGLPKLQSWVRAAEARLRSQIPERQEDEAREKTQVERGHTERRHRLLGLGETMTALRRELALREPKEAGGHTATGLPHSRAAVELDTPFDTHWAWPDSRFDHVLHLFSQEWFGIRAAAGYLPGRKIAVTANDPLRDVDRRLALDAVIATRARSVVVHGYSDNMLGLALAMKRLVGESLRVQVVWHGSTAQFHLPFEIGAMARLLELRRRRQIDGLACIKPGMALLGPEIHPVPIYNVGPRLGAPVRMRRGLSGSLLVPVPDDWMKNFHTNVLAAASEPRVRRVFVLARTRWLFRQRARARVIELPRLRRPELFRRLSNLDMVLNATLTECQPMTALEALSHRVPCVTGRLGLGQLDAHPLQQLCQMVEADNATSVRQAVGRVLDLREKDPAGLEQMMDDYEQQLRDRALAGYLDWIHA
ncbi:MAG: class I SAM-dependent methyltransferase [Myxococcales bacterium]